MGEENGTTGSGPVRWLVDPLDGTTNYVHGLPAWAVSIAAELDGRVAAAVVHASAQGVTYTASAGAGAWCIGSRLTGPRADTLSDAVVATGFTTHESARRLQLDQLAEWLPHVRDVRCHGAAALELCAVATGQIDGYLESDLQEWDVAAGSLLAREAGAVVTGGPGTDQPLIAGSPALVVALVNHLRPTKGAAGG